MSIDSLNVASAHKCYIPSNVDSIQEYAQSPLKQEHKSNTALTGLAILGAIGVAGFLILNKKTKEAGNVVKQVTKPATPAPILKPVIQEEGKKLARKGRKYSRALEMRNFRAEVSNTYIPPTKKQAQILKKANAQTQKQIQEASQIQNLLPQEQSDALTKLGKTLQKSEAAPKKAREIIGKSNIGKDYQLLLDAQGQPSRLFYPDLKGGATDDVKKISQFISRHGVEI